LGHLKVLELCNLVAGPYCAKLLADLGAEVIKVERPGAGDESRGRGPFLNDRPDGELSGLFLYLNTNKLGITLDVSTTTGRKVFLELVERADVLVEDNARVLMERLGLTYEDLRSVNPGLIVTSITPFGHTGPYRNYRAQQLNAYHGGGEGYLLPIMSEDLSREPLTGGSLAGDCVCGLSAALATLAAAYSGGGQHIDISRQDVLSTMVQLDIAMFANLGYARSRLRQSILMPLPMRCRDDGYLMVSALTDREWASVVEFMGSPEWADEERYGLWLNRHLRGDEINPHVEEFTRNHDRDDLFHRLQGDAIAAAPVNTPEDLRKSPQMAARGFFVQAEHAKAGRLDYATAGYKMSETPCQVQRTAPLLGEHNTYVYCERLGYDRRELAAMMAGGII
jgi:crotonobetainyl-CoA:carnitine CoA-transferase CaiB-like acyl-CoA transferase